MGVLVELNDVSYAVPGRAVYSRFSFVVREAERVLVAGPSGSGKTSTLRMVVGLEEPSAGTISRFFEPSDCCFIPQDLDLSDDSLDVFYGEVFSWKAQQGRSYDRSRAASLLHDVELDPGLLDSSFRDLSGGERQRALAVLALLLDKPLTVLDEVTAALDAPRAATVVELLSERLSGALLVVSHDEVWKRAPFRIVELPGGTP